MYKTKVTNVHLSQFFFNSLIRNLVANLRETTSTTTSYYIKAPLYKKILLLMF